MDSQSEYESRQVVHGHGLHVLGQDEHLHLQPDDAYLPGAVQSWSGRRRWVSGDLEPCYFVVRPRCQLRHYDEGSAVGLPATCLCLQAADDILQHKVLQPVPADVGHDINICGCSTAGGPSKLAPRHAAVHKTKRDVGQQHTPLIMSMLEANRATAGPLRASMSVRSLF